MWYEYVLIVRSLEFLAIIRKNFCFFFFFFNDPPPPEFFPLPLHDALPIFTQTVRLVGRCASKTSLRGAGFGVKVASPVEVGLQSLAIIGSPKPAVMADHDAHVSRLEEHTY